MPSPRDSTAFDRNQFELAYPEGIERHYWYVARNRMLEAALRGFLPAGARILDVGTGRGTTVAHLRRRGFDCHGVELAPVPVSGDLTRFVKTGVSAMDLEPDFRESISLILMLDVLEHLPEPVPFLRDLLRAFPAACRLLLTLPARRELWSNYDDFYGHFRRYSPELIRTEGEAAGWRLESWRYAFRLMYWPLRSFALSGRSRPVVYRAPASGLSRLAHRGMGRVIHAADRLLPDSVRGTSLLAVLSRRGL